MHKNVTVLDEQMTCMSLATWEHKPAPGDAAVDDTATDAAHDVNSSSASGAQIIAAHETEALHSTDELEENKVSLLS
jgi:hypothetical protein